jgi:hypothetical protein
MMSMFTATSILWILTRIHKMIALLAMTMMPLTTMSLLQKMFLTPVRSSCGLMSLLLLMFLTPVGPRQNVMKLYHCNATMLVVITSTTACYVCLHQCWDYRFPGLKITEILVKTYLLYREKIWRIVTSLAKVFAFHLLRKFCKRFQTRMYCTVQDTII